MPDRDLTNTDDIKYIPDEKFRIIFDNLNNPILILNFLGQILEANRAACSLLYYSREQLLKQTLLEIVHSEYASKIPENINNTLRSKIKKFESAFMRRNGYIIPVEISLKLVSLFDSFVILAKISELKGEKNRDDLVIDLENITQENPNPILRVNKNSILFCNYTAQELFHIKKDAHLPDFLKLAVNNSLTGKSHNELEVEVNDHNYHMQIIAKYGEDYVDIYGIDITERRKAEDVINYLAKFPSKNPNPLLWVSKDSVIYSNYTGEELFGVKKGSSIPEFLKEAVEGVMNQNEFSEVEIEFDDRIYLLNISRLENQDYIAIQGIDISERKKAEKILTDYSQRIEFLNYIIMMGNTASNVRSFLEEILTSTLNLLNFDGGWIYLSNDILKTAEIVCSQNLAPEFLKKKMIIKYEKEFSSTLFTKGEPFFIENFTKFHSREAVLLGFLSLACVPLFSNEKIIGSINLGSINQYTFTNEEKEILRFIGKEVGALITKMHTEEALKDARIITDFYKDLVVHDINNLFQNIDTSIELIALFQKKNANFEKIDELMDIIREQIVRGAKLISNIRHLSKISETGISLESTQVVKVLNDAIKFIQVSFPNKTMNIQIDSEFKKIFIEANEFLLDVFENILFNAFKYNDSPIVEISIRCSKEKREGNNHLKIEFKDNGIGIPDNRKEDILKSVSEGNKRVKGMGIGLFTVNKIVGSYKGSIWVEDRIKGDHSQGSNFIILIPLVG